MITATRRIQFCAGHRVYQHESRCAHAHGHNYVALVEAEGVDHEKDPLGRVIDFSVLKARVGGWIDDHWDHGFIVADVDNPMRDALAAMDHPKVFVLDGGNPTAENMAIFLLKKANELLRDTGVRVVRVVLWETENCSAEAT